MRTDQLRLWLAGVSYMRLVALRQFGLAGAGTEMMRPRRDTICLKLLQIGASVAR
jgi:hypothetical protein